MGEAGKRRKVTAINRDGARKSDTGPAILGGSGAQPREVLFDTAAPTTAA